MAVAVAESKSAASTDGRRDDEPLTAAVQGALKMLELFGHVVLANSDELREVSRGQGTVEQSGADGLPHGSLPSLINDGLHEASR
jgi:hypothetical protein